jgi:hypothetical protein
MPSSNDAETAGDAIRPNDDIREYGILCGSGAG